MRNYILIFNFFNFWGLHPVASVTMICFGCAFNRNIFFILYSSFPVYKTENTAVRIRHADHVAPTIRKSWH
jgi:hypothetical protein